MRIITNPISVCYKNKYRHNSGQVPTGTTGPSCSSITHSLSSSTSRYAYYVQITNGSVCAASARGRDQFSVLSGLFAGRPQPAGELGRVDHAGALRIAGKVLVLPVGARR